LYRLVEDGAVINRMGFNSEGHDAVVARLRRRQRHGGIVAVNLGANRDSTDRVSDYVAGLRRFCGLAAYITVNVSSPNTPSLRDLQYARELERLVASLAAERDKTGHVPIVVKIAPDLDESELNRIGQICLAARIDGIAVSNTTTARPHLISRHRSEPGGLSGRPLFSASTRQLARLWLSTEGAIPLIGIGGISDAETAWTKITAGASLLQLYTALVFRGPRVVDEILTGIEDKCREQGFSHFGEAIGSSAESLAHQGLSGT
jgi:dihydroorotate dehydrogenase